jgi:hypothetical protein
LRLLHSGRAILSTDNRGRDQQKVVSLAILPNPEEEARQYLLVNSTCRFRMCELGRWTPIRSTARRQCYS